MKYDLYIKALQGESPLRPSHNSERNTPPRLCMDSSEEILDQRHSRVFHGSRRNTSLYL